MLNRVYCTYFDHNYLPRGLALYHSLQRHAAGARLWVLCLSDACYRTLVALDLPNLIPRWLTDFEATDPGVAATRPTRSMIEYYFTCSPAWMLFVLNNEPDAEWVTYLDGDLYFFAWPDPIYDEMKDAAFGIVPHRFTKRLADHRRFRIYNVGWVSVRRATKALPPCAGGANAASNGVTIASRATVSPTSATSIGCLNYFPASTSSGISAPIWRPGISPTTGWNGVTDRWRSRRGISCCSFIFTG